MIRKTIFWSHLIVVLVLCLTGALLSFEQQSVDWAERSALALPPAGVTERLPTDELVACAAKIESTHPTNVRYANDPRMPVRIGFANGSIASVNAFTGAVLGRGATSLRAVYRFSRGVHVLLAMPKQAGQTGSAIVGACNLAFVFLLLTGSFLWWPRKWQWSVLRNSIAIRFDGRGRQRDWNWHNAFGFWALVPLFIMAATGVVLSYQWANQGMREFARQHGSKPVAPVKLAAPRTTEQNPGWPGILESVERRVPGWSSMNIPWPGDKQKQVTIMVSEGYEGEAHKRVVVTVDRATAAITQLQTWENQEAGDRARAIVRNLHTGGLGGLLGQALAGLGCLAGGMLAYTGFSLSWRRFFGRKGNSSIATESP